MAKLTKEEYIEAWIDRYCDEHPDEKISDFEELRERADCAWYDTQIEAGAGKTEFDLTAEQEKVSQNLRKGARMVDAYGKERKRERKPNELKRELIQTIYDALKEFGYEDVQIVNIEQKVDIRTDGRYLTVALTEHRAPKTK